MRTKKVEYHCSRPVLLNFWSATDPPLSLAGAVNPFQKTVSYNRLTQISNHINDTNEGKKADAGTIIL
jgi:hypothetical protein